MLLHLALGYSRAMGIFSVTFPEAKLILMISSTYHRLAYTDSPRYSQSDRQAFDKRAVGGVRRRVRGCVRDSSCVGVGRGYMCHRQV